MNAIGIKRYQRCFAIVVVMLEKSFGLKLIDLDEVHKEQWQQPGGKTLDIPDRQYYTSE